MIYIYDIILNLNKELIEFFEWEDKDSITYVRRIPMYKVSSYMIKDIINNDIKIENKFLINIKNKTLLSNKEDLEYLILLTDERIILGVLFDELGNITSLSRLTIDEEDEVLELTDKLTEESINYKIIRKKEQTNNYLTRKERKIMKKLQSELNCLYKENKIDKLNYFYYEYFNRICNDKEKVYNELLTSIKNNFNEKHLTLYEILKLSSL